MFMRRWKNFRNQKTKIIVLFLCIFCTNTTTTTTILQSPALVSFNGLHIFVTHSPSIYNQRNAKKYKHFSIVMFAQCNDNIFTLFFTLSYIVRDKFGEIKHGIFLAFLFGTAKSSTTRRQKDK